MNLREIRKESGIKAAKVAKELGVSRRQLYTYEERPEILKDEKIEKLCEIYRLPKDEIMKAIHSKGGQKMSDSEKAFYKNLLNFIKKWENK